MDAPSLHALGTSVAPPPGPVADAERADDPVVHDERHRERGAVAGGLDTGAGVVTQLDPRVVQDVRRDDRPPVADGDATGARALGEDDLPEARTDGAGHRHRLDVPRLR